jgi:peptidoglycan/LPS O-acetylase OafA/YrhL
MGADSPDSASTTPTGRGGFVSELAARPTETGPAPARRDHFACFNGLRAIAAIAVLMTHVASSTGADTSTSAGYVFSHLDVGVTVFFLLSGFLLYRPFVAAHLAGRPSPSVGNYLLRRALRILPAYWLALTFFVVVLHTIHFHGRLDVVAYYGLIQIYWGSRALGGIVPAWSLAVEASFYVFLPVYAALMARWAGAGRRAWHVELWGVAVLYATGIGTHALLLATHPHATVATLWLPSQIDLFALGMALAVVSAYVAGNHGPLPRLLAAAGRHPGMCWAFGAVAFWTAATQLGLPRTFGDLPPWGEMGRQVCYALTGLGLLLPAVFGPQEQGQIRRLLRSRPANFLGLISYGVFLWHLDLLNKLVTWHVLSTLPQARFLSVLILTSAVTLPFAAFSYVAVERPLIGYRRAGNRR